MDVGNAPNDLPAPLVAGLARRQLPALDGIRAIAALLVVFYHAGMPGAQGGTGVLIFFVLSGFLITWLLLAEEDNSGTISLKKFYMRRSLRIFPAFYAYWILYVVAMVARGKSLMWPQTIAALLYVNNYYQAIQGDPNTGLSHTWSLAIEEQFYLLWPTLFLLLRRNRKRMAMTLAVVIVGIWAYRLTLRLTGIATQGYVYEAFDMRADHLLIGCLMAVLLRARLLGRFWRALCCHPLAPLVPLSALIASSIAESYFTSIYRDTVAFILNPLLAAVLIAQMVAFSSTAGWNVLNLSWMQYLGRISYGIYLYQQVMVDFAHKWTGGFSPPVQWAVATAVSVAAASASYFVVEKYFLSLKERFRQPPARTPAAG